MLWSGADWRRAAVRDDRDGPLPGLLLSLTIVTGLVDAVSILSLGRVFVANMTGNVVFIGFAVAGAKGFSLAASVAALAGFLLGAGGGGFLAGRLGSHRGRLLLSGLVGEVVFVGAGLLILGLSGPLSSGSRDAVAGVIAVGLGAQNVVVRALAVPDLTTTVLTMTLTGLASDARHGIGPTSIRRLLAVTTMFGGAAIGAILDIDVSETAALGTATAVLFAVATGAALASRGQRPWHAPKG